MQPHTQLAQAPVIISGVIIATGGGVVTRPENKLPLRQNGRVYKIRRPLGDLETAAYTHTSVAIADALAAVGIPAVEVHLTDLDSREEFRRISFVRPVCAACVKGPGFDGYTEAMRILNESQ